MSSLAPRLQPDDWLEVTAHVNRDITSCLRPPPLSSRHLPVQGAGPMLLTCRQQPSPPPPPPPRCLPTHPPRPGSSSANMTAPADDDKCRGGKAITESARCSMQALAALITSRLWSVFFFFYPPYTHVHLLNGGAGHRPTTA